LNISRDPLDPHHAAGVPFLKQSARALFTRDAHTRLRRPDLLEAVEASALRQRATTIDMATNMTAEMTSAVLRYAAFPGEQS
jgi:hypothetical protein